MKGSAFFEAICACFRACSIFFLTWEPTVSAATFLSEIVVRVDLFYLDQSGLTVQIDPVIGRWLHTFRDFLERDVVQGAEFFENRFSGCFCHQVIGTSKNSLLTVSIMYCAYDY